MATLAELIVKIGADITDYEKKMKDTLKSYRKVADGFSEVGKTLTVGVSLPLMAVGTAATKMAMDAVESENLFEVSMGGMADSARAWSEQLRKQLGLNSYEVRKNAATFYDMFNSMGLSQQSAYDLSTGLTQLAYDLSSFKNIKPEEAFEKLRSGIVGEVEPLRNIGIVVDEATVKAYAYKTGIAQQGQELTNQQKILARYGLIMAETGKAQGDLARTIDSPTNRLRILSAELQEVSTKFGMALLPTLQSILTAAVPFVEFLGKMADGFNKLSPGVKSAIVDFTLFVAAIGPIIWGLGSLVGSVAKMLPLLSATAKAIKTLTIAQWGLNAALDANIIGIIILALAALAAGAWYLAKNIHTVELVFVDAWGIIKRVAYSAVMAVLNYFKQLLSFIPGVSEQIDSLRKKVEALQAGEIAAENARKTAVQATQGAVVAGQRYQAMTEKAAESTKAWNQGLGDTAATMSKAVTTTDIFTYKLDRLQKAWQLFSLTTALSSDSREYLIKQQQNLKDQLSLVSDQLGLTEEAYTKSIKTTGLWSEATMELGKTLDDLAIKQAELKKQVDETNKSLAEQAGWMSWADPNERLAAMLLSTGQPISGTAAGQIARGEKLTVPIHHSGGVYQAPGGRAEGLAWLQSGETIIPRGSSAGVVVNAQITIHEATDANKVARIAHDAVVRAVQDAVRQGA